MAHKSFRISSSLFVAIIALLSLSSQVGAAGVPVQATRSPSTANPKGDPIALWSITWSASSRYHYYHEKGATFVGWDEDFTQSGSTIVRQYADGTWDNSSFEWHVTDDSDETWNGTALDCSGYDYGHITGSITDPDRYSGVLNHVLNVSPQQLPDGTWRASVPFDALLAPSSVFTYPYDTYEVECGSIIQNHVVTTEEQPLEWPQCFLSFPGFLEGDAQGNDFTYHNEFNGLYSSCYYAGATANLSVDVTAHRLLGPDLTVKRLEVTQGLQDEANNIPLVRGRKTVVRAFIDLGTSTVPIPNVTGQLTGYAGGTLLGTVTPFNPNEQITAPVNPDWKNINDTLNFELPYAWTLQPSLTLTVEVNPNQSVQETNYGNNKKSQNVQTLACEGISIAYEPIHYAPPGGYVPPDPSANIKYGQLFMQKIFPIPDGKLEYKLKVGRTITGNINDDAVNEGLVGILDRELLASSPPRPGHIHGWLPSEALDVQGRGENSGHATISNDTEAPNLWRVIFAHETAHNYGIDDNGIGRKIPPLTTRGRHWFDVYAHVIKPVPAGVGGPDLVDLMDGNRLSAGDESWAWISPQNYLSLISKMCPGSTGSTAAPSKAKSPHAGDNLLVTGIVSDTTPATGRLDPLLRLSTVPTDTLPGGASYCVNLKDASANLLNSYCFNQSFEDSASVASFGMVVPYPTGLNRVELTSGGGTVLSSREASAHPPSVTVTFPNAAGLTLSGNQTITWTGSDADGDALTYDVLYSRDNGATWMGVGADINGTSFSLDFSALPGTNGASGLIKVMVSDGFYSSESISANPFTVGNKPPIATILSPSSGASFTTGPQIALEGSGEDLEDGSLGGSALSWVSSKDGALGTGQVLEVNLSPGDHTITLTVADSGGLKDTDSIQVTVVQSTSNTNLFLPLILKNP